MEKNVWKVVGELVERVDGELVFYGFILCLVIFCEFEQFYWDKEYLSVYVFIKVQFVKENFLGYGYYLKIDCFFVSYCKRGELYIEFLKGVCEEFGIECCVFCKEWSGF